MSAPTPAPAEDFDDAPTAPVVPGATRSQLGFFDSLYAAAATLALTLASFDKLKAIKGASFENVPQGVSSVYPLLASFLAAFFVIDDWLSARPILGRYGYNLQSIKSLFRMWLDVFILLVSFLWIVVSPSPFWYVGGVGALLLLGWLWAWILHTELKARSKVDLDVQAIMRSHPHAFASVCLVWGLLWVMENYSAPSQGVLLVEQMAAMSVVAFAVISYKIAWIRSRRKGGT